MECGCLSSAGTQKNVGAKLTFWGGYWLAKGERQLSFTFIFTLLYTH